MQVEGLTRRGPEVEADVVGRPQQSEGKKVSRQVGQEIRASGRGRLWGQGRVTRRNIRAHPTPPRHRTLLHSTPTHTAPTAVHGSCSAVLVWAPPEASSGAGSGTQIEMLGLASERPAVVS